MNHVNGEEFFSGFDTDPEIEWQMSRSEKYCLINFVQHLQPQVAIEIGTFRGGSLQVLSRFTEKVYSVDINETPKNALSHKFRNTTFLVGDSPKIIPELIKEIESSGQHLGFVLIDGDHTTKGVQRDIEAVINYPHQKPLVVFLHDAFNPPVRRGIRGINYKNYPHVKYAELDYICGSTVIMPSGFMELWGGFAMILIDPSHHGGTILKESFGMMQKRLFFSSVHVIKDPIQSMFLFAKNLFR